MEKRKIFYVVVALIVVFIAVQTVIDVNKEKKTDKSSSAVSDTENKSSEEKTAYNGISEQNVLAKIEEIKKTYPDGMFWNHMGTDEDNYEEGKSYVTSEPCNHNKNNTKFCNIYRGKSNEAYPYAVAGRQSVGFASLLSDLVFGKEAEAYSFTEYDKVRVGDQARIDDDTRTVFIIGVYKDYIEVAEVNYDGASCQINWGRSIEKSKLGDAFYISRY